MQLGQRDLCRTFHDRPGGVGANLGLELLSSDSALGLIIVATSFGSCLAPGAQILLSSILELLWQRELGLESSILFGGLIKI